MPLLKRNIITLFLLSIVYAWFLFSHVLFQKPPVNVLGAESNVYLFVEPSAGETPILDAINNAKNEILVEVYLMSDKQIIDALINAKARGVKVDVMLEEHPFGGGNLNNKTKQLLESSDISFEWTSPSFSLTHEKSIVIDKSEVFILNQNLTGASFSKNREYDVIDTNPEDVSLVREIFIDDWERKSFNLTTSHLIVSPNNSRQALTAFVKNATKTIEIEIEDIGDNQIESLLSEEAKRMQIRLIVPTLSQIKSNEKALKMLSQEGVLIKTLSSPYIHAKLIIIDGLKAYVGSVNLSTQSMDENRELGIILFQNDSIQTLSSFFEDDWNKAQELNY